MFIKHIAFMTLCGASAFLSPALLSAAPEAVEKQKDELMNYFPQKFVAQTLEKFKVPQEQRAAIQEALADKDAEVIALVEEKAGKMDPNPLRDPRLRREAVKIFREALLEVFTKVANAHGIDSKEEIKSMLEDIQRQKAEYYAQSLEERKEEAEKDTELPKPPVSRQPSEGESDGNDFE